ncbi:MAG: cytochrome C oxidase subunit IV family protein [Planctomycetota bacterium]
METTSAAEAPAAHPHMTVRQYFILWLILLALLAAGVLFAYVDIPVLANVLVFGVAVAKAIIVLSNYMHLRWEPRFITLALLGALSCILVLFLLTYPDMVLRDGWNRP